VLRLHQLLLVALAFPCWPLMMQMNLVQVEL
jgi:hypothetical protein